MPDLHHMLKDAAHSPSPLDGHAVVGAAKSRLRRRRQLTSGIGAGVLGLLVVIALNLPSQNQAVVLDTPTGEQEGTHPTPEPTVVPIPTTTERNGDEAEGAGQLVVHANGCSHLHLRPNPPTPVLWPPGYSAQDTGEGVAIFDEGGDLIANEGQYLVVSGGGRIINDHPCGERFFVIGEVISVTDDPPDLS